MSSCCFVHVLEPDPTRRHTLIQRLEPLAVEVRPHASADDLAMWLSDDRPECVISPLVLPTIDGLELQKQLGGSGVSFIFVADQPDAPMVAQVIRRGAIDCLEYPVPQHMLLRRVREATEQARRSLERRNVRRRARQRLDLLTAGECDVLDLLTAGYGNKQAARKLDLSIKTIEARRARLREKLGVESLAEMVRLQLLARMCEGGHRDCPMNDHLPLGNPPGGDGICRDICPARRDSAA